jgi:multidrug efflux pump subunit AcrA (membrane-fusion protein)
MSKQMKTMEQLKDSRLLYDKKLPAFGYILIIIVTGLLVAVVIWSIRTPKTDMITSSGTVQSPNKNYIMSPFTGKISDVSMKEGQNVEKGDTLFTVKSTDLDLQSTQLGGQKKIYESQIAQYQKLVKSIQDNKNYFDASKPDDSLYYNQYETYKSQVAQQTVDTSTFKAYGYTDEQIQAELVKNQNKVTELYYTAIKTADSSMQESKNQLDALNAQLNAVDSGQQAYVVTANATGTLHLLSDYKEGMSVQATSPIASISSKQDNYEVQAYVSVSDEGW